MSLEHYLQERENRYDPEVQLLRARFHGPGYHSTTPPGTWVHPTRESAEYALALLLSGTPERIERGWAVLRRVLSLQDTDPDSRTYGVWPWHLEEPLEKMSPPDLNWADFIGATLATILIRAGDRLSSELMAQTRAALGHACRAIKRRNVGPAYTNIAIMGAGVTLAGGELLDDPALLRYGRDRLRRIREFTAYHGTFTEYNSPTYTLVALRELERILALVQDAQARDDAQALLEVAWEVIAEHFHPSTGQWVGPHSRSYADWLDAGKARQIAERTGVPILIRQPDGSARSTEELPEDGAHFVPPMRCPKRLVERFRSLPSDPYFLRQRLLRAEEDPELDFGDPEVHRLLAEAKGLYGFTWFTQEAALGSVNRGVFWTQQRPLIGYWRTPEDLAVCLRLRFLHDGRDFASATYQGVQRNNRVLCTVGLRLGGGDWHLSLDRPADNRFEAEDFRLRWQLTGRGVSIHAVDERRYLLQAGGWKAVVHIGAGRFGNDPIRWETTEAEGEIRLDGVCYSGPRRTFDFTRLLDSQIVTGVELIPVSESPSEEPIRIPAAGNGASAIEWCGLRL
ncbi:MAG: hypothetical protein KatS3mg115_1735 [Candidatus Poribacteria bacterium]|nr:MAG: hypothetical protein KatS3mg115_1735 [Candidatus Poribacteria bacterium]